MNNIARMTRERTLPWGAQTKRETQWESRRGAKWAPAKQQTHALICAVIFYTSERAAKHFWWKYLSRCNTALLGSGAPSLSPTITRRQKVGTERVVRVDCNVGFGFGNSCGPATQICEHWFFSLSVSPLLMFWPPSRIILMHTLYKRGGQHKLITLIHMSVGFYEFH